MKNLKKNINATASSQTPNVPTGDYSQEDMKRANGLLEYIKDYAYNQPPSCHPAPNSFNKFCRFCKNREIREKWKISKKNINATTSSQTPDGPTEEYFLGDMKRSNRLLEEVKDHAYNEPPFCHPAHNSFNKFCLFLQKSRNLRKVKNLKKNINASPKDQHQK